MSHGTKELAGYGMLQHLDKAIQNKLLDSHPFIYQFSMRDAAIYYLLFTLD